jgi:tetratricopeptide (TPR) repeat protein
VPAPPFQQQQMLAQAQRLHAAGEVGAALPIYQQLHRKDPKNPKLLYLLGAAELSMGHTIEARAHLTASLKLAPTAVGAWNDLALVCKREGRFDEALAAIDRAIALRPQDPVLTATRAGILVMTGEHAAAAALLRPQLDGGTPNVSAVLTYARIAGNLGERPRALALLRARLEAPGLSPGLRADVLFGIGALLDSQGDFDGAFEAFRAAHALRPRRFDAVAFSADVGRAVAAWTRDALGALPRPRLGGERAVFIVGMPRSGTSLVEQILSSHPGVFGAGELDDVPRAVYSIAGPGPSGVPFLVGPAPLDRSILDQLSRAYADRQRAFSPTATRITDKMPANLLHLGVIAAAFPQARVIHCTRDPLDTCLSCYAQNFGPGHAYTHDLADLGAFERGCRRLAHHWRQTLPLPILEVVYEQLVADLEGHARRMLDFLALPWDPACLDFHRSTRVVRTSSNDQVRRPIYTGSIGRWKNYRAHLGPLIEALGPDASGTTPATSP